MLSLYLDNYGMNVNGRNYDNNSTPTTPEEKLKKFLVKTYRYQYIDIYKKYLNLYGFTEKEFYGYITNTNDTIEIDKRVQDALAEATKEIFPSYNEDEVDREICCMFDDED